MIALFLLPLMAAAAESGSELAALVLKAYGGSQKIREIERRGLRSDAHQTSFSSLSLASNQYPCHLLSKDNQLRFERMYFGQPAVFGFDGKTAWTQTGDWVSKASESTVRRLSEELSCGLLALDDLDNPAFRSEAAPAKQVGGRNCPGLKLIRGEGKGTTFYLDPQTFLVARCEYDGFDSEQGINTHQAVDYGDYRQVGGFPVAFRQVRYSNGRQVAETRLIHVAVEDIADAEFAMPPESFLSRLERGPVVVPFEYARNFIVVQGRINNSAESAFIVDTGASQTVIDKRLAGAIGPYTTSTVSVTAGSKAVPLSYAKAGRLLIGDLALNNIAVGITDLNALSAALGRRISGLLGANVLRRFAMTIDYDSKKLLLSDPRQVDLEVRSSSIVVPTSPAFNDTGLVVRGKLDDGTSANFLVDTGANFNKLPQAIAAQVRKGPALALGHMTGLDGQKVSFGALKLKKLALGSLVVNDPVFGVAADKNGEGLFSSPSMGLLGNPIWSKFKLTLDYRGERLIIDTPPDWARLEAFVARIKDVDRAYLRNSNVDIALSQYETIFKDAEKEGVKAAQALAVGRIAGCYADRYARTKDLKWMESARREYERADKLANEARNRSVEGQVLAGWAMFYLTAPRSSADLEFGKGLIEKALRRCPPEPTLFAALAAALVKRGQFQQAKDFTNQALLLDPGNWQALWTKYRIAEQEAHKAQSQLVLSQIEHYYADFPQVREARSKLGSLPAGATEGGGRKRQAQAETGSGTK